MLPDEFLIPTGGTVSRLDGTIHINFATGTAEEFRHLFLDKVMSAAKVINADVQAKGDDDQRAAM